LTLSSFFWRQKSRFGAKRRKKTFLTTLSKMGRQQHLSGLSAAFKVKQGQKHYFETVASPTGACLGVPFPFRAYVWLLSLGSLVRSALL
jgi:hypothetical protein